jgi:hypothetical protein
MYVTASCDTDKCPFSLLLPALEDKEKNGRLTTEEAIQLYLLRLHNLSAQAQKDFFRQKNSI